MKKIFIFFSLISSHYLVIGQSKFGFTVGLVNARSEGFPEAVKTRSIITIEAGAFLRTPIGKNFIFLPGLEYIGKGVKVKNFLFMDAFGNQIGQGNIKTRFDYIDLNTPLLFDVLSPFKNLKRKRTSRIFFGVGPYLAYAFNANNKLVQFKSSNGSQKPKIVDPDFNSNRRLDAGICFSMLVFSPGRRIMLGGKNEIGLISVSKNGGKVFNSCGIITVSYIIN